MQGKRVWSSGLVRKAVSCSSRVAQIRETSQAEQFRLGQGHCASPLLGELGVHQGELQVACLMRRERTASRMHAPGTRPRTPAP